jgi:hypothetical protein
VNRVRQVLQEVLDLVVKRELPDNRVKLDNQAIWVRLDQLDQ